MLTGVTTQLARMVWGPVMCGDLAGVFAALLVSIAFGVLVTGSDARRQWYWALLPLSVLPAFLVPPSHPLMRYVVAHVTVSAVFRGFDLYIDQRAWSVFRRIYLMLSTFDSREMRHVRPRLDASALTKALAFGAIIIACGVGVTSLRPANDTSATMWRWVLGAVLIYALGDALEAFVRTQHALKGFAIRRFHHHPLLSWSLQDFWGCRWNQVVHGVLFERIFKPFARRRMPRCGLASTFLVSGLIHFYLVWIALDITRATMMGSYFIIQSALVLVERHFQLNRLPFVWRKTWIGGALILPSPLFVEPFLSLLWP